MLRTHKITFLIKQFWLGGWRAQVYCDWSALLCVRNAHTSPVCGDLSLSTFFLQPMTLCASVFCSRKVCSMNAKISVFKKWIQVTLFYSPFNHGTLKGNLSVKSINKLLSSDDVMCSPELRSAGADHKCAVYVVFFSLNYRRIQRGKNRLKEKNAADWIELLS